MHPENTNAATVYNVLPDIATSNTFTFHADGASTAIGSALEKEPEVAPSTKTKFATCLEALQVVYYEDGYKSFTRTLMPDIADVEVVQRTVIVRFMDGTRTKATLDTEDAFSLEQGISICLTKKLLGKDGSSIYNKLIERALKIKKKNEDARFKAKLEEEEVKRRKAKYQAQREKRKQRRREEAIAIQAEAYARALRMVESENKK